LGDGSEDDEGSEQKVQGGGAGQQQAILLSLSMGQPLKLLNATPEQHFTRPPPRYTEASLVKSLEQLGIGRPSTYAATLKVLQVGAGEPVRHGLTCD
jgi:DNA topoisomerase-1